MAGSVGNLTCTVAGSKKVLENKSCSLILLQEADNKLRCTALTIRKTVGLQMIGCGEVLKALRQSDETLSQNLGELRSIMR